MISAIPYLVKDNMSNQISTVFNGMAIEIRFHIHNGEVSFVNAFILDMSTVRRNLGNLIQM